MVMSEHRSLWKKGIYIKGTKTGSSNAKSLDYYGPHLRGKIADTGELVRLPMMET
jgi:hypothetical protein